VDQRGSNERLGSDQERHPAITAAATLFFLTAAVWVVHFFLTAGYFLLTGAVLGQNSAPHGKIEDAFGVATALMAYGLYAAVLVLGVLAGVWLWRSRRRGAVLGALTLVAGPPFWDGFGLPYPPIIAFIQLGLMAVGWRSLR